jgi:beta-lactamase superfamily II metal-dependent hydrolase
MIEIEFIPVGEKTDTGDALLLHFTEPGTQTDRVVLIDGGFKETADVIVPHIEHYYGTSRIDLVVCTHPDDDHINGLFGVIEQMAVTELLIHRPASFGYTSDDVKAAKVDDLITHARARGTIVTTDAFAGKSYFSDAVRVAGPTRDYYISLLQEQTFESSLLAKGRAFLHSAASMIRNALKPRTTDPGEGELSDGGGTTARNNTSIILDVHVDGYRALFTGDAGAPALERCADYLQISGRDAGTLPDFFDVPHHGSRHNLTTPIMDRLAGPIVGATGERTAFVSVGREADDFPRPEVANAFTRRGYEVCATRGQKIRWSRNAGPRSGWVRAEPMPWVEAE